MMLAHSLGPAGCIRMPCERVFCRWVELSSRQIRCGYLDLDLYVCFVCSALILLPFARVERGTKRERANRKRSMYRKAYTTFNNDKHGDLALTIAPVHQHHLQHHRFLLLRGPPPPELAGSHWRPGSLSGHEMRDPLGGRRQQLSTGLLLQTTLAAERPARV